MAHRCKSDKEGNVKCELDLHDDESARNHAQNGAREERQVPEEVCARHTKVPSDCLNVA